MLRTPLVAGTVFRENGFSLPGAAITLAMKDSPQGAEEDEEKPICIDARGEFAFRVLPVAATYIVRGSMKGFKSIETRSSVSAAKSAWR